MSNLIGSLLIGGFFTFCYISNNPEKTKKLVKNVSWYIVSSYHRVAIWYEDSFMGVKEDNENIKIEKQEIVKVELHGYNDNIVTINNVNQEQIKDLVKKYDLSFLGKEINNKIYFKRLENINEEDESEESENSGEDDSGEEDSGEESVNKEKVEKEEKEDDGEEEKEADGEEEKEDDGEEEKEDEKEENVGEELMIPCVRHFLQVEFISDEEKYDIHEHISKYYITNNVVMDEVFMKYFMKYWYDVEINSDYKLKIIDKNIKLVTLEKGSKVKLGKDDYEIKN